MCNDPYASLSIRIRCFARNSRFVLFLLLGQFPLMAGDTIIHEISPGWAATSVNATIFRRNSVISDGHHQYVAYYDPKGQVVVAKRRMGDLEWTLFPTPFSGNVKDAHNGISMMVDGRGFLHLSWDHHNNPLNYARSRTPGIPTFSEAEPMTGDRENVVSYPEFYAFSNGDLLFAYRDGGSGNGNLVINQYRMDTGTWERMSSQLIDGQGERNPYWQIHIDRRDTIHLSWVWRESPDAASNHDLCYMKSMDRGVTWVDSQNQIYPMPATVDNAEVVHPIPQNHNLINQTSMTADEEGRPYIATYFRASLGAVTQFHLVYQTEKGWTSSTVSRREKDFSLGGAGTRSLPVSRPQVLCQSAEDGRHRLWVIYRDEAYGNQICVAHASLPQLEWEIGPISPINMKRWEPSYDTRLWRDKQHLHLFHQVVGQGQGETLEEIPPQMVSVLEWRPDSSPSDPTGNPK